MVFPLASSWYTTGETWVVAKTGARGGGFPSTTHRLSQYTAASRAQCVPPVLMGTAQLTTHGSVGSAWRQFTAPDLAGVVGTMARP